MLGLLSAGIDTSPQCLEGLAARSWDEQSVYRDQLRVFMPAVAGRSKVCKKNLIFCFVPFDSLEIRNLANPRLLS